MTITITRDSAVLWLGIIGGILTTMAAQADLFPPAWKPWITMISAIIAALSGKLASSPLAGETTPAKESRPALLGLVKLSDKP